ncbi:MAG: type IV secretory system conjugative DNA transfer family protein [Anaerolineae bacterium]|nr:type IV secretory system conjugative DNA transfer family protein [Anaerolineae bacterium]
MIDLKLLLKILFGDPVHPPIPNIRTSKDDTLYFDGLTRGTAISGDPGTGKTSWEAGELKRYAITFPDGPIIVYDLNSSLTNEFNTQIELMPDSPEKENIQKRIVVDIPGHETHVLPKPIFSPEHGLSEEDLVQVVTSIIEELNPEKIALTPMMAQSLEVTAPQLARLIMAIRNEYGESWQVTEGKKLLMDEGMLKKACKEYGHFVPEAKWYFENQLLAKGVTPQGYEARTSALIGTLSAIESRPLRARYGHYRPHITYKEIIDKGLIYFVSGEKIANQEKVQAWVYWCEFALLRALINLRTPHDPNDKPVLIVIDEVYKLFEIRGMANALGQISTYFRSRKLMAVVIIQAFWQLDERFQEQYWNFGNIISFAMSNHNDAYTISQQLGQYNPTSEKFRARSNHSQPVAEADRGQYLMMANWLQNLKARQMVMRRYSTEQEKDPYLRFVEKTRDKLTGTLRAPIAEIKEEIFKRRAIPIRDALEVINKRTLQKETKPPSA